MNQEIHNRLVFRYQEFDLTIDEIKEWESEFRGFWLKKHCKQIYYVSALVTFKSNLSDQIHVIYHRGSGTFSREVLDFLEQFEKEA